MTYKRFLVVVLGVLVLRSSGSLDPPVNLPGALVDADRKSQEVVRSLPYLVSDLRRGFVRATEIDAGDSQDLPCPPSVGMPSLRRCLPGTVPGHVLLVLPRFLGNSPCDDVLHVACAEAVVSGTWADALWLNATTRAKQLPPTCRCSSRPLGLGTFSATYRRPGARDQ